MQMFVRGDKKIDPIQQNNNKAGDEVSIWEMRIIRDQRTQPRSSNGTSQDGSEEK